MKTKHIECHAKHQMGDLLTKIPNDHAEQKIHAHLYMTLREYYTTAYPSDDLGKDIRDGVTFWQLLGNIGKVYELSVSDSIVRERLFEALADLIGVDYDIIYNAWLCA